MSNSDEDEPKPTCLNQSPSGSICRLPAGHLTHVHQETFPNGRSEWTDTEERGWQ